MELDGSAFTLQQTLWDLTMISAALYVVQGVTDGQTVQNASHYSGHPLCPHRWQSGTAL